MVAVVVVTKRPGGAVTWDHDAAGRSCSDHRNHRPRGQRAGEEQVDAYLISIRLVTPSRASAEITLAGAAATKLVAADGAGGVAVTVRGLRAGGLSGAEVADGMVCFGILTYGVYVVAVAVAGFGLWFGLSVVPLPLA